MPLYTGCLFDIAGTDAQGRPIVFIQLKHLNGNTYALKQYCIFVQEVLRNYIYSLNQQEIMINEDQKSKDGIWQVCLIVNLQGLALSSVVTIELTLSRV